MKNEHLYTLLAVLLLVVSIVPIGVAAYLLGFVHGESPCVLCWEQRTGMALVALVAAFILRFGPRPRYIGLGVLVAAHGIYMGVRHSALHWWRDVGQGFAGEFFGAHTYTWSAFIFWVFVVAMGLLLVAMRDGEARGEPRDLGSLGRAAIVVFLLAVAGNIVQAFASTGPPPFIGQSDPVRFSFDPRHWVWSLEEWQPAPISLRGRYAFGKPSLDGLEADWKHGPLAGLPVLVPKSRTRIAAPLDGAPTDIAYEPGTDRFVVATDTNGVLILDGGLSKVLRSARVDAGFSVDLGRSAGAAWVDADTVAVLGDNKSYVLLKEKDGADPVKNFRFFLEGADRFEEVSRGRFGTVRGRMMYVASLAYDAGSRSFYTVTIPNRRAKRLVVSRLDRKDMTLSEEFLPGLGPALSLAGEKRTLDEYYVTGAAIDAGRLYAISAAYSTLLVIDLASHQVVSAYALEDLRRPCGLGLRGDAVMVLGEDGDVVAFQRPR